MSPAGRLAVRVEIDPVRVVPDVPRRLVATHLRSSSLAWAQDVV